MNGRATTVERDLAWGEATLDTYPDISFDASREWCGPQLPPPAYENVDTLSQWYELALTCWYRDCNRPRGSTSRLEWRNGDMDIVRPPFFREAFRAGLRRLHDRLLHELRLDLDSSDEHHPFRISNCGELSRLCRLFQDVIGRDEMTIRDRRSLRVTVNDSLAHELGTGSFPEFREESHQKVVTFEPDDPRLLVLWSTIAGQEKTTRELFTVEDSPAENPPPKSIIERLVPYIWRLMRRMGEVCGPEPTPIRSLSEVRNALDQVIIWCDGRDTPQDQIGSIAIQSSQPKERIADPICLKDLGKLISKAPKTISNRLSTSETKPKSRDHKYSYSEIRDWVRQIGWDDAYHRLPELYGEALKRLAENNRTRTSPHS